MTQTRPPHPPRRSSGRPKGADSAARREEILATAARVFSEEGYRGTPMSAIARASGLSQTGLLHYFPTKEDLLEAVMERRDELDSALALAPTGERPRGWAFMESIVRLVRVNQGQPGIVRLYTTVSGEAVDPAHPANAWLVEHHTKAREMFRVVFREAAEDGALRPDAPVESLIRCLVAGMDGLQIQWLSDDSYEDMAGDFEVLVEALTARWKA
ncbi:TetR/AcrR family transcriptional regulator [Sinomonas sp. ASV322]|uniref:TetR/AcrR family transcriptional regulator n=1 Tax=Sinomonas sp. ASV322 TaxID=3041920 RepID=UPI0027DDCA50|nr:TetR/AcrR family transcriptional regulator [Sinomonas sp. ASV322]MDQ4503466.1 TetR/AcrR family transcriptional regulator [Sinomonas sp. ASV322]